MPFVVLLIVTMLINGQNAECGRLGQICNPRKMGGFKCCAGCDCKATGTIDPIPPATIHHVKYTCVQEPADAGLHAAVVDTCPSKASAMEEYEDELDEYIYDVSVEKAREQRAVNKLYREKEKLQRFERLQNGAAGRRFRKK